eukprot:TRINITY_DN8863_c0_g1_i1.p1 TRINITY_DN8863_c0_g1~~TRINITY_DN8863_c0_g1_i1.p1  ORF type:complete len:1454 (+),score=386.89 TRINITY_DN8863_c0_g1_i1:49-4362(+)
MENLAGLILNIDTSHIIIGKDSNYGLLGCGTISNGNVLKDLTSLVSCIWIQCAMNSMNHRQFQELAFRIFEGYSLYNKIFLQSDVNFVRVVKAFLWDQYVAMLRIREKIGNIHNLPEFDLPFYNNKSIHIIIKGVLLNELELTATAIEKSGKTLEGKGEGELKSPSKSSETIIVETPRLSMNVKYTTEYLSSPSSIPILKKYIPHSIHPNLQTTYYCDFPLAWCEPYDGEILNEEMTKGLNEKDWNTVMRDMSEVTNYLDQLHLYHTKITWENIGLCNFVGGKRAVLFDFWKHGKVLEGDESNKEAWLKMVDSINKSHSFSHKSSELEEQDDRIRSKSLSDLIKYTKAKVASIPIHIQNIKYDLENDMECRYKDEFKKFPFEMVKLSLEVEPKYSSLSSNLYMFPIKGVQAKVMLGEDIPPLELHCHATLRPSWFIPFVEYSPPEDTDRNIAFLFDFMFQALYALEIFQRHNIDYRHSLNAIYVCPLEQRWWFKFNTQSSIEEYKVAGRAMRFNVYNPEESKFQSLVQMIRSKIETVIPNFWSSNPQISEIFKEAPSYQPVNRLQVLTNEYKNHLMKDWSPPVPTWIPYISDNLFHPQITKEQLEVIIKELNSIVQYPTRYGRLETTASYSILKTTKIKAETSSDPYYFNPPWHLVANESPENIQHNNHGLYSDLFIHIFSHCFENFKNIILVCKTWGRILLEYSHALTSSRLKLLEPKELIQIQCVAFSVYYNKFPLSQKVIKIAKELKDKFGLLECYQWYSLHRKGKKIYGSPNKFNRLWSTHYTLPHTIALVVLQLSSLNLHDYLLWIHPFVGAFFEQAKGVQDRCLPMALMNCLVVRGRMEHDEFTPLVEMLHEGGASVENLFSILETSPQVYAARAEAELLRYRVYRLKKFHLVREFIQEKKKRTTLLSYIVGRLSQYYVMGHSPNPVDGKKAKENEKLVDFEEFMEFGRNAIVAFGKTCTIVGSKNLYGHYGLLERLKTFVVFFEKLCVYYNKKDMASVFSATQTVPIGKLLSTCISSLITIKEYLQFSSEYFPNPHWETTQSLLPYISQLETLLGSPQTLQEAFNQMQILDPLSLRKQKKRSSNLLENDKGSWLIKAQVALNCYYQLKLSPNLKKLSFFDDRLDLIVRICRKWKNENGNPLGLLNEVIPGKFNWKSILVSELFYVYMMSFILLINKPDNENFKTLISLRKIMVSRAVAKQLDIYKPIEIVTSIPFSLENMVSVEEVYSAHPGLPVKRKIDLEQFALESNYPVFEGHVRQDFAGRKFISCSALKFKDILVHLPNSSFAAGSCVSFFLCFGFYGPMAWNVKLLSQNYLGKHEYILGPLPKTWNVGSIKNTTKGYLVVTPDQSSFFKSVYPRGLVLTKSEFLKKYTSSEWKKLSKLNTISWETISKAQGKVRPEIHNVTLMQPPQPLPKQQTWGDPWAVADWT